jgi:hypothetical protein
MNSLWPPESNIQATSSNYPSLYATGSSGSAQMGADNDFAFPVQSVGTDTSPENSNQDGSGSRSHSNQPTPSTVSNQNSTHTSYTSPPNQSSSSTTASTGQSRPSPGYIFANGSFDMNMPSHTVNGPTSQQQPTMNLGSTGMTPGPTGMTPIPDALWPAEGLTDGNEWMYSWPGSTPQPQ